MALSAMAFLAGCASKPAQPVEAVVVRPIPTRIALVSVVAPPRMVIENRGSALGLFALPGLLAQRNMERTYADRLTQALRARSLNLGEEMTAALSAELTRLGYTVEVIRNARRPKDDPEGVEYDSIQTDADAIVTARYDGYGMYAGQFSTQYLPRLNVDIEVVRKSDQADLHAHSIYYGADASRSTDDQIPADARYAYGSFEQVMARPDEVAEGFRTGMRQIAALAAKQLHKVGRP